LMFFTPFLFLQQLDNSKEYLALNIYKKTNKQRLMNPCLPRNVPLTCPVNSITSTKKKR
jgi:hypothetical protein